MILCKDYFLHHICKKQIKIGKTLVFAWAAITKYHRLGGLNNRNLPITVVEAVKSNINVPAVLVPGEGSFPSLQTGNILLRAHMAFLGVCTWQGRGSLLAAVWREQWKPTAPTCTVSLMPSCLLSHSEG